MTKQEKIKHTQACIAKAWACTEDSFTKDKNIIFETDKQFFEIATFGYNAVIRADKSVVDWCFNNFSNVPAEEIMDGENLFHIEAKMREHGKKLGGEHLNFLHLHPEAVIPTPAGFTFELYEKDRICELYSDNRFENALGDDAINTALAIVAKKENEIAAIVAVDSHHRGLWQMGIDTLAAHRGQGLAAYLVKEMALESERRNQVPFYATWSANIASMRVALGAGFRPVWTRYFSENI